MFRPWRYTAGWSDIVEPVRTASFKHQGDPQKSEWSKLALLNRKQLEVTDANSCEQELVWIVLLNRSVAYIIKSPVKQVLW